MPNETTAVTPKRRHARRRARRRAGALLLLAPLASCGSSDQSRESGRLAVEGESCLEDSDCDTQRCALGTCTSGLESSYCFVDDNCVAPLLCKRSKALEKDACASGAVGTECTFDRECDPPLVCQTLDGASTCRALANLGETCFRDEECAGHESGVACVRAFNPPHCAPLGVEGKPCAENSECLPGLVCAGEIIGKLTCAPQPPG